MIGISSPPRNLSAYENLDSEGNAMVKDHAYLAQSDGFVCATVPERVPLYIRGYVGLTNDPVGAGDRVGYNGYSGTGYGSGVNFLVAKNEYFEITSNEAVVTIFWKSWGPLKKPIDNN